MQSSIDRAARVTLLGLAIAACVLLSRPTLAQSLTASSLGEASAASTAASTADAITEVITGATDGNPATAAQSAAKGSSGELRGKELLHLEVNRDTWISSVDGERLGSNGGSPRLKLKSYQEMSLLDVDPSPVRGRVVEKATLHLRSAPGTTLHRITVSSCSAPWNEGSGTNYAKELGASTFNHRAHPSTPWSFPGSDLTAVVLGLGNSTWSSHDASPADAEGWQQIAVDPQVIASRVADLSYGFLIFDDTGSEWQRDGERFTPIPFPNRYFFSRQQNAKHAPYFQVALGAEDLRPPQAPSHLLSSTGDLPEGEVWVSWLTPSDDGPAGTIGFNVDLAGDALPRYLIPRAGVAGQRVQMRLRDLTLASLGKDTRTAPLSIAIAAVDAAGNVGPALTGEVSLSTRRAPENVAALQKGLNQGKSTLKMEGNGTSDHLHQKSPTSKENSANKEDPANPTSVVRLGDCVISVLDELDKVHPVSGRMIPDQADDYRLKNHLWNAGSRRITLSAARSETIAFQILLDGPVKDVTAELHWAHTGPQPVVHVSAYANVPTDAGPMPDPIVPLTKGFGMSAGQPSSGKTTGDETKGGETKGGETKGGETKGGETKGGEAQLVRQNNASLHIEIDIPDDMPTGLAGGQLRLGCATGQCDLNIELQIWNFAIPKTLGFLAEMNCYGLPDNELDYYRLAHRHRTTLNRVPYSHRGTVSDGCAPKIDGNGFNWDAWDRRFGPLFDGTAFIGLPRSGTPVECFYLPLFENWPIAIEPHYNGGYWADRSLSAAYREQFVLASQRIAEHVRDRGWNQTLFQFYLNGKNDFKQQGWSRSTSPWLLDEPAHYQDFAALRWFGQAFHEGVDRVDGAKSLVFRADISRPQWQRDSLDGIVNYNVVGSALREYRRTVLDRRAAFDETVVEYGTTNRVEQSNLQPMAWCWDAWSMGIDGVLPWQTMGTAQSWNKGDELALFYPSLQAGEAPAPSVRLKAYRRGQQDAEYMAMAARSLALPRWELGQALRKSLGLDGSPAAGVKESTDPTAREDAGRVAYNALRPQDFARLRHQIAAQIVNQPDLQRAPDVVLADQLPSDRVELAPLLPSLATREMWTERAEELRAQWQQFLGTWPEAKTTLDAQFFEKEVLPTYSRQRVTYQIEEGVRTDAMLLVPNNASGKLPAIVLFHPTYANHYRRVVGLEGEDEPERQQAVQLVERGYIVLCPRCFIWDDGPSGISDATGTSGYVANVQRMQQRHPDWKGMMRMTWDGIRAIDFLEAQASVDTKRIGLFGHSLGAKEVLYVAAFDPRARCIVSSEGGIGLRMSNWQDVWYLGKTIEQPEFRHDHHELLGLIAPRPFLLLAGNSADDDKSWQYIASAMPIYRLLGAGDNLGWFNHGLGHRYAESARAVAEDFLDQHLKLPARPK